MSIITLDSNTKHALSIWQKCLTTSIRTTFACIIVAILTLHTPLLLRHYIQFPAFSYVTLILLITNSSLGDGIRGLFHFTLSATLQTIIPAIFILRFIVGPITRLTPVSVSLLLGAHAFMVAIPEWSHAVTKRVALGQLVIVYVVGFINGDETDDVILHPLKVAVCTCVGAVACVVGLLLPFPELAGCEVRKCCEMFVENVGVRVKLLVKAFSCATAAGDNNMKSSSTTSSESLISQAKSLAGLGSEFLVNMKSKQDGMRWERFIIPLRWWINFQYNHTGDRFQKIQTILQGMEIALSNSSSSSSISSSSVEVQNEVNRLEKNITQNLEKLRTSHDLLLSTSANLSSINDDDDVESIPNGNNKIIKNPLQQHQPHTLTFPLPQLQDLSSYFFLFCLKLLNTETSNNTSTTTTTTQTPLNTHNPNQSPSSKQLPNSFIINLPSLLTTILPTKHNLHHASKLSLSLTLSILLGLNYSKPDGFWAGLPIAITFISSSTTPFTSINAKAQGTVLGTVYGVIITFLFHNIDFHFRLLTLLPWFIFTAFLQRGGSKFYGQAGSVSAVIGAVLILGRRNFGSAKEFAIARIVETFIGLICGGVVELIMKPTRSCTLVKCQLSKVLRIIDGCVGDVKLLSTKSSTGTSGSSSLLMMEVSKLRELISEAEIEPSLWFVPFHGECYRQMLGSLSHMVEMLSFSFKIMEDIMMSIDQMETDDDEGFSLDGVNEEMDRFKNAIGRRIQCIEVVTRVKSITALEKQFNEMNSITAKKNMISSCDDIEMGGVDDHNTSNCSFVSSTTGGDNSDEEEDEDDDDYEMEKILSRYIDHHVREVGERMRVVVAEEEQDGCREGEGKMTIMMMVSLGALGFCMGRLGQEIKVVEKEVRELLQWENPKCEVKMGQIRDKVIALSSK